jgi:hypothetical protein
MLPSSFCVVVCLLVMASRQRPAIKHISNTSQSKAPRRKKTKQQLFAHNPSNQAIKATKPSKRDERTKNNN